MHNVGSGGDGIRAEEETFAAFVRCGYQTPSRGFVAGYRGICAMLKVFGFLNGDGVDVHSRIVAIVVAVGQHFDIGCDESGLLGELAFEEVDGFVYGTREEPAYNAEGEHVARFENGFVVKSAVFEAFLCQFGQSDGNDLYRLGDTEFGERIVGLVEGFFKVFGGERVGIYNDYGIASVHCLRIIVFGTRHVEFAAEGAYFECCGVHSHNHICLVARGINSVAETYLETTYAAEGTLRGANFSGEVGQGGNLVTQDGTERGEHISRQLHTIAGVSAEANYNSLFLHDKMFFLEFCFIGLFLDKKCNLNVPLHKKRRKCKSFFTTSQIYYAYIVFFILPQPLLQVSCLLLCYKFLPFGQINHK